MLGFSDFAVGCGVFGRPCKMIVIFCLTGFLRALNSEVPFSRHTSSNTPHYRQHVKLPPTCQTSSNTPGHISATLFGIFRLYSQNLHFTSSPHRFLLPLHKYIKLLSPHISIPLHIPVSMPHLNSSYTSKFL